MVEISLPRSDGSPERYRMGAATSYPRSAPINGVRAVYAAAHVVADPLKLNDPWRVSAIDWDATLAFRHHLWRLGFKMASISFCISSISFTAFAAHLRNCIASEHTVPLVNHSAIPWLTSFEPA